MTPSSEALRIRIRDGTVECTCPPSILAMGQHLNLCPWQKAVEMIYLLEREDENISSDIHCERGADEGQEIDGSGEGH